MFKNLDGFKKVEETKDAAVMRHPKGHSITIAKNSLPALHRKQLSSLPLHIMAEGGKIVKLAAGGMTENGMVDSAEAPSQEPAPTDQEQTAAPAAPSTENWPILTPASPGASGSWDTPAATPDVSAPTSMPMQQTQPPNAGQGTPDKAMGSSAMSPQSLYGLGMGAINDQARAEKNIAGSERVATEEYQNSLAEASAKWDRTSKDLASHIEGALTDVKDGKINPDHYMESRSTPQKVATAIGLFLGGFSTAYTHQGNPAMEILNKQIDRDIDAQKAGVNNKMNIYHAYLEQYKNAEAAENMTRATQLAIYGSKIKQAALDSANPLISARAKQAELALKQQMVPLVERTNFLMQTKDINDRAQGNGQLSPIPPEQLVKYSGASEQDKNKMYEEIKGANIVNNIRKPSLDAFDMAAKEVRPLSGGIGTSLTSFVPGMDSQGQKAFSGLANTTVQDIEGTARQAAFDSIQKNFRPQFGDSDATIASKRAGWEQYLNSHSAAPVANGYGINLQNFHATATRPEEKKIQPVERVGADGKVSLFNPQTKQFLGYK